VAYLRFELTCFFASLLVDTEDLPHKIGKEAAAMHWPTALK